MYLLGLLLLVQLPSLLPWPKLLTWHSPQPGPPKQRSLWGVPLCGPPQWQFEGYSQKDPMYRPDTLQRGLVASKRDRRTQMPKAEARVATRATHPLMNQNTTETYGNKRVLDRSFPPGADIIDHGNVVVTFVWRKSWVAEKHQRSRTKSRPWRSGCCTACTAAHRHCAPARPLKRREFVQVLVAMPFAPSSDALCS